MKVYNQGRNDTIVRSHHTKIGKKLEAMLQRWRIALAFSEMTPTKN